MWMKHDNVRRMIDDRCSNKNKPYLLGPLLSAASIHANTSGVFKGFYKNSKTGKGQFGGDAQNCLSRITKEIILPAPIFSDFECDVCVFKKDTNVLIKELDKIDVAYFDPPYNQHPYGSNYFMLNIICDYKKPVQISKISGIPTDWNRSDYNKKDDALKAFNDLINNTNAEIILISYSNEGILSVDELSKISKKYGKLKIKEKQYNAFRGSRNLKNRDKDVEEILFIIKKG